MIIVDRVSQLPNGAPVDPGTEVKLRRAIDGALLATQLTDIDGWVEFQMNGSPGPTYTEVTIGGETRYRYGRAVAQVGSWFEGEWKSFMDMVTPGVIFTNNQDSLKVVPGVGLQVRVSPGTAMSEGVLGIFYQDEPIALGANGSGNPRNDLIVLQMHYAGNEVGKVGVAVFQGAPAATPVDPAIPEIDDVAHLSLARVRVQSGVGAILASDIEDLREGSSFLPDGSVTEAKLAPDSVTNEHIQAGTIIAENMAVASIATAALQGKSVTAAKIADKTITAAQVADGSLTARTLADSAVTSSKIGSDAVNNTHIKDGTIVPSNMAPNAIETDAIRDGAVTGAKILFDAVDNTHIKDGTIVDANLATAVKNKLNVYGSVSATLGIGNWVNFSSTSWTQVQTNSISIPSAGKWLIFVVWDGRIGSQSDNYGAYQTKITRGGFDVPGSLLNWETNNLQGIGMSTTRAVTVSTAGTHTFSFQARRTGGVNGKIEGATSLYAIKVGP